MVLNHSYLVICRSCKLLATFMYYALTTGAGLQTLGEEYCDILMLRSQRPAAVQTSQAVLQQQQQEQLHQTAALHDLQQQRQQLPPQAMYGLPATHSRALLVLLESLGPPLIQRLVSSLDRAVEMGSIPPDIGNIGPEDHYSFSYDDADGDRGGGDNDDASAAAGVGHNDNRVSSGASRATPSIVQFVQKHWQHAVHWLTPRWPEIKSWMLLVGRLHLAAFYLHGTYYEWTKRLMGITYTSISASKEQRASYRVLGYMLVLQLAISAGMQAKPQLMALRQNMSGKQLQHQARQQEQQHALVLPDDYDMSGIPSATSSSSSGNQSPTHYVQDAHIDAPACDSRLGSGKQCALCLSSRSNPSCTPCGHVFCWHCIAQWCTEKPECPLCRTAVVPSQLVCLYHSDF